MIDSSVTVHFSSKQYLDSVVQGSSYSLENKLDDFHNVSLLSGIGIIKTDTNYNAKSQAKTIFLFYIFCVGDVVFDEYC